MRAVAIVFTPDYASQLEKLAFHTPVWLVDTPENRSAAEETWRQAIEWPHISVTLFRPPDREAAKEEWLALIEQIRYRERAVDTIDAIGVSLTAVARAALEEAGFRRFEESSGGFRARR